MHGFASHTELSGIGVVNIWNLARPKTNDIFFRISALASKKSLNQKLNFWIFLKGKLEEYWLYFSALAR